MKVLHSLDGLIEAKSIGLGFFDGIHLAHREIIKNTVDLARNNGVKSAIITFEKSPFEVFGSASRCRHGEGDEPLMRDTAQSGVSYITTNEQKTALIESLGVDYLYILDFSTIKNLSGEKYIEEILCKNFEPKFITTGFNHHFGINRSGSPTLLTNLASKFGYKYFEIPPQKLENELISSSTIKKLIEQGDLKRANSFLGRDFEIEGEVQVGSKLGRTINFPTANLIWQEKIIKLPHGVYSGNVRVDGTTYKSLINWGSRPTVDNKSILEAHIIDFKDDIYGQKIAVSFEKKLRDIVKFENLEELKRAIEKDYISIHPSR